MALIKHEASSRDAASQRRLDRFDRFFDEWPDVLRRPLLLWPERGMDAPRVEEFTEDGQLVIRVELPGVDPERDVDVSLEGDVLRISAERREEERSEGRDYVRRELRYGAFHRELLLPKGVAEQEVQASYADGILEVRLPVPKVGGNGTKKIPVARH